MALFLEIEKKNNFFSTMTHFNNVMIIVTNHQKLADYRHHAKRRNPYMALFHEIVHQGNFFSTDAEFKKSWTNAELFDLEK